MKKSTKYWVRKWTLSTVVQFNKLGDHPDVVELKNARKKYYALIHGEGLQDVQVLRKGYYLTTDNDGTISVWSPKDFSRNFCRVELENKT